MHIAAIEEELKLECLKLAINITIKKHHNTNVHNLQTSGVAIFADNIYKYVTKNQSNTNYDGILAHLEREKAYYEKQPKRTPYMTGVYTGILKAINIVFEEKRKV